MDQALPLPSPLLSVSLLGWVGRLCEGFEFFKTNVLSLIGFLHFFYVVLVSHKRKKQPSLVKGNKTSCGPLLVVRWTFLTHGH